MCEIADALLDGGRRGLRALAARRLASARRGGAAARAVPGGVQGRARRAAQPAAHRVRALLRRGGRHAPGDPFTVRFAHQQGLGPGAAQAHVPQVQLRAAGQRAGGQHRAVAGPDAQLRAGGGAALPEVGQRARSAGPGAAGRADVRHPLALERHRVAGGAPHERRPQGAAAVPALRRAGPADGGVPGPACLCGEPRRRTRDSRPSAGGADAARLPARDDGRRRLRAAAVAHRGRRSGHHHTRPGVAVAAVACHPQRAPVRLPRRRRGRGAAHQGREHASR